jgi:hypothetical protein
MGTRGYFPGGKGGWGVKLTTHLHLVPRSRMCGAIHLLPPYQYAFIAWCSVTAQGKSDRQLKNIKNNDSKDVYYAKNLNKHEKCWVDKQLNKEIAEQADDIRK